jgi:hypothetical protein
MWVCVRARVCVYLHQLTGEHRRVVGRLHEHAPGDNLTVMEGLSTQPGLGQATCIDQFEHLEGDGRKVKGHDS